MDETGKDRRKYLPEGMKFEMFGERHLYYSKAALVHAKESGEILEGIAQLCDEHYDLTVELGCMQGKISREQVAYDPEGKEKEIAIITRVGKAICFKVVGFSVGENGEEYAVLSRKAAQIECRKMFLNALVPGDVIPARVTHMEPFGAFVDIGCGCVSLLPIDCISVSRISHPADRFRAGMSIYVILKSIDRESGRFYVSHKELLGTWEENASEFRVGQTVRGIVRSVEEYGVFIELTPNLAGLAEYREDLQVGQSVSVYIKSIMVHRMKIKLVVVDTACTQQMKKHFDYCIPKWHMDYFQYSPVGSDKIIQTVFCQSDTCQPSPK